MSEQARTCASCHSSLVVVNKDEARTQNHRCCYLFNAEHGFYEVAHSGQVSGQMKVAYRCGLCGTELEPDDVRWFQKTFDKIDITTSKHDTDEAQP